MTGKWKRRGRGGNRITLSTGLRRKKLNHREQDKESEKLKILMSYDTEEGLKKQGAGARQREMEKLKTARGNRAQRKENEKTGIRS